MKASVCGTILNSVTSLIQLRHAGANFGGTLAYGECGSYLSEFSRYTAIQSYPANFGTTAEKCMWMREFLEVQK